MEFPGPLSQQFDLFRIYTAYQFLEKKTWRRRFILKICFTLQHALVVTPQRVHGKRPNVAFIGDRTLQETHNGWLRFRTAILKCSHKARYIWKIGFFRQESRDFHVRVHPVLKFPIKFQEKFVVKDH